MNLLLVALAGLVLGAAVGYLIAAARGARSQAPLRERLAGIEATLAAERQSSGEKLRLLADAEAKLKESFAALSSDALQRSQAQFLELATTKLGDFQTGAAKDLEARQTAIGELLKPVRESLATMDRKLGEVDKSREATKAALEQLVAGVKQDQARLVTETGNLVKALRAPHVRGRWGEIQLRRVVELAGMIPYSDFQEQTSTERDGSRLRPDLIVRLPGGKTIVVDSKAPLAHYLEALEAPDENGRLAHLVEHARAVREHVVALSAKDYSRQFAESPEFVVLFLPGETFFSAALENDPSLIEFGVERDVVLATPTTLIALLRAVAFGWRQERLAKDAQAIAEEGKNLFDRLATMGEHFSRVGTALDRAVDAYNDAVGSLESRVLPSGRRLKALAGASLAKELPEIEPVDARARPLQAEELVPRAAALPPPPEEPA